MKIKSIQFLLSLAFFFDTCQIFVVVHAPPAQALAQRPCWKGDVRMNSCVEALMNRTFSNIATVQRLLKDGKIPNSSPISINLAVGCLLNENFLPYDGDCSACGLLCATILKSHTEFCALYCPTPPPTPQRTAQRLQPIEVVGATQATTLPNEERIGLPDETWSLNLSEVSTGISSRGETSAPERSLTTLVGTVVIDSSGW